MSESRYSIVADLTRKKLNLIDDKLRIDNKINEKKEELRTKSDEFVTWKTDIPDEVKRIQRKKESSIVVVQEELRFLKDSKKSEIEGISSKIVEIDNALERLETISKAASEQ